LHLSHGVQVAALGEALAVEPVDGIAANVATQLQFVTAADAGGFQGVVVRQGLQLGMELGAEVTVENACAQIPALLDQGVDQLWQGLGGQSGGREGAQRRGLL